MDNSLENKSLLLKKLLETNAFWSFDKNTIKPENISDNTLIENTFIHGDVEEIKFLFQLYPKEKLLDVWNEKLIPDERYYKLNYYLGVCFFEIPNTKEYIQKTKIKNSRYEKLRQLAIKDKTSIS
ncbi:MAG: hypothetical protein K9J13_01780 [Saprospiraceae bacterium]|nr:hypothetical protein [Saprospiraceae bacterium]